MGGVEYNIRSNLVSGKYLSIAFKYCVASLIWDIPFSSIPTPKRFPVLHLTRLIFGALITSSSPASFFSSGDIMETLWPFSAKHFIKSIYIPSSEGEYIFISVRNNICMLFTFSNVVKCPYIAHLYLPCRIAHYHHSVIYILYNHRAHANHRAVTNAYSLLHASI